MRTKPIAAGTKAESFWHEPVYYDIANSKLMAQMDGKGGFSKYSVAGKFSLLKENTWYSGFSLNGKPLENTAQKAVTNKGKWQQIEYMSDFQGTITQELFPGPNENTLFSTLSFVNEGEATVNVSLHLGFELDYANYYLYRIGQDSEYRLEATQIHTTKKGFQLDLGEEFNFCFLSNLDSENIASLNSHIELHYDFQVEAQESKALVFALSGATAGGLPALQTALDEYSTSKEAIVEEVLWQEGLFESNDSTLNSMYGFALNAAISSYKNLGEKFNGFFAGIHYQSPPRTYFRDGYWTVLPVLPYKPEWVRKEIVTLAYGIGEDGACPSGVIYHDQKDVHELWWPDHYDSPSFFVMMVHDYLAWTHDRSVLEEVVNGTSILDHAKKSLHYLIQLVPEDKGLFLKPENCRDWADNVVREGIVLYDNALFLRALYSLSEISRFIGDEETAWEYDALYQAALHELEEIIESEAFLFNYRNSDGTVEDNVSIEWALLVVFGLVGEDIAEKILHTLSNQLETRNNEQQTYGDWGVMAAYPFYSNVHHLDQKSMAPYRYHNGGDWPYLDGVYAWAKMMMKDADWRYPLTRWFTYSLEQGWLTPVEYYGPVYGKGSNLQGWSAMPAAAMLMGGLGLNPQLNATHVAVRTPAWGESTFRDIHFRGETYDLSIKEGMLEVIQDGEWNKLGHPFALSEHPSVHAGKE